MFGLVAAQAAYRDGQEWLTQALAYLEANRDYLVEFFQREFPEIGIFKPEGTFLAWLDCRKMGLENPYQFFLEEARVALNDGLAFGEDGKGFVRMNFGCSRAVLQEALTRMKAALQKQERCINEANWAGPGFAAAGAHQWAGRRYCSGIR